MKASIPRQLGIWRGATALLVLLSITAVSGLAAERDPLPVVIKGSDLPWSNNVPISQIYLYRYNGPSANPKWTPIPFQIDKRRETYLLHNIYTWTQYSALPTPPPDICANTYFPPNPVKCDTWSAAAGATGVKNCPDTYMVEWNDSALKWQDEIVFMARDVVDGQLDACPYDWLDSGGAPGLSNSRVQIQIQDADDVMWVYAYRWTQPPPPGLVNNDPAPVSFQVESCAPCTGGAPGANAHNICGTGSAAGHGSDPGYRVHLASNWLMDRYELDHGGTWTDLLDSIGMRAGNEDPTNWSCNYLPRKHGTKQPGAGQVRFIRSIQGAQSGYATVRIDKGYDTMYETEIELRVHDLEGPEALTIGEEHSADTVPDSSAQAPFSAVWTKTSFSQTTPTHHDRMSADAVAYPPTTGYTNQASDWNQMMDSHHGGIAAYLFEDPIRGELPVDDAVHTYADNATLHGDFGRSWSNVSCLQDGLSNNGGCGTAGDPESLDLLFRRLWYRTIPLSAVDELNYNLVKADDYELAAFSPVAKAYSDEQVDGELCGGGGPCIPVLQVIAASDGTDELSNWPSNIPGGCSPGAIVGYGITRQIAGGVEEQLAFVGAGGWFRDMRTKVGVTHTYRSFSIGTDGSRSAKTAPVTVTPQDTEPPSAPSITVTPLDQGAIVGFVACEDLINAANIYVSSLSGGPYTKVNTSPIYTSGSVSYAIPGLQNGRTYYVVAKTIDVHGNYSAYSAEAAVTPQP
ncbi:MAG: hypothetical protein KBD01_11900 [Acidobacteria bacterium]|nr:hypothetical protein [Acidobacteriota bacterium]